MKRISALTMLSVAMLALGSVLALRTLQAFGAQSESSDEAFFKSAAAGGLVEVTAGKLAQDRGTTPAIRDYGGLMVKDHSTADQKLWSLAAAQHIDLPKTPDVEQVAAADKLKLLSGDTFDRAYIRNQIDAHRETVALFKKEIASGKDPRAKQFASATLPTVQQHLDKIMQIASTSSARVK